VSFAIPQGKYVGIVGPNGGGKTTLIKIILGLLKPSRGSMTIFGKSPLDARRHVRIGYVPQHISQTDFDFPATAREIVETGRTALLTFGHRFTERDHAAVHAAMQTVGILHAKDQRIGTLSGGERQKVFIARALAQEPKLLILDEPTTGVDIAAKDDFYALLKKLHTDSHLTILFVTHDVEIIAKQAEFVLALHQKLICHCSSHEFLSDEVLRRLYGGDVELLHSHTHTH
jgi:zinc transport system ATP-binding protein